MKTHAEKPKESSYEVVIIGGGVSGLSAAAELRKLGVRKVVVLEREMESGGAPRHICNPSFGLREFKRPLYGPQYAGKLVERVQDTEIVTGACVTSLLPGGAISASGQGGPFTVEADRVILATGTREASRHARMASGARPAGIMTYGALQRHHHFARLQPFTEVVVVGSEYVAFAALDTLKRAGIRPVCLLEENDRTTAPPILAAAASALWDVPIHCEARLIRIIGKKVVEGVEVEMKGRPHVISCNGVLFTGRFIPEAHLVQGAGLEFDAGSFGPITDQYQRLSDPVYFACGNVLRPVAASWNCFLEGKLAARWVKASMDNTLPRAERSIRISYPDPLRFVWPQRIAPPIANPQNAPTLKVSMKHPVKGELRLLVDGREVWAKRISTMPDTLITVRPAIFAMRRANSVEFLFDAL